MPRGQNISSRARAFFLSAVYPLSRLPGPNNHPTRLILDHLRDNRPKKKAPPASGSEYFCRASHRPPRNRSSPNCDIDNVFLPNPFDQVLKVQGLARIESRRSPPKKAAAPYGVRRSGRPATAASNAFHSHDQYSFIPSRAFPR